MILTSFLASSIAIARYAIVVDKAIPLNELLVGQSACVSRVAGRPDHVHRLEEFGLRAGTRVQMFRAGNPCIIRMGGNKVCLRSDQLLRVMVKPAVACDGEA